MKTRNKINWPVWASLIIIILVMMGTLVYALGRSDDSTKKKHTTTSTPSEPAIKVPTQTSQSEGSTIQIPDNVDPGAVKNYELITENENFKIRKLDNTYTITLYAIVKSPGQSPTYKEQLATYKKEALDYLTAHSINADKASIIYDPAEASQL